MRPQDIEELVSKLDVKLFTGAEMEAAIRELFGMPANIKQLLEPLRLN